MSLRVLIIDDEKPFADMLDTMLRGAGYDTSVRYRGEDGLAAMAESRFDLVLCDIKMPRMNGLELLDAMAERELASTVIIMSAFGTIDLAIEALRRGAYDYISKPFKRDEVILVLRKAEEREQLRARVAELEEHVSRLEKIEGGDRPLLGESEPMRELKRLLAKVAAFPTTVLLTGESGTGKELVARAIHRASPRADKPFVAVNCGAIPETLLESELFGHMRGAFTDAHTDKPGLFVEAHTGTLLLDEVGELPASLQVGLLRVLQEGEVRPVGSSKSRKVDVRVIAATHRNLGEDVAEGRFREDLYYRLNVLPVHAAPLRDRASDIPLLSEYILGRIAGRMGFEQSTLDPAATKLLLGYSWPGNVRELENVLERAMVLSEGSVILPDDLPPYLRTSGDPVQAVVASGELSIKKAQAFIERELIKRALAETGGNRTQAAKLLELSHRALLYKIKDYDLRDV
ncbi:MAG: sigma-54 dependent transcriptional regulator [Myxococcota bacterium]